MAAYGAVENLSTAGEVLFSAEKHICCVSLSIGSNEGTYHVLQRNVYLVALQAGMGVIKRTISPQGAFVKRQIGQRPDPAKAS